MDARPETSHPAVRSALPRAVALGLMIAVGALALGAAFHFHGEDGGPASTCLVCKIAGSGEAVLGGGGSLPGAESPCLPQFVTQTIPHTSFLTGLHSGRAPPSRV